MQICVTGVPFTVVFFFVKCQGAKDLRSGSLKNCGSIISPVLYYMYSRNKIHSFDPSFSCVVAMLL